MHVQCECLISIPILSIRKSSIHTQQQHEDHHQLPQQLYKRETSCHRTTFVAPVATNHICSLKNSWCNEDNIKISLLNCPAYQSSMTQNSLSLKTVVPWGIQGCGVCLKIRDPQNLLHYCNYIRCPYLSKTIMESYHSIPLCYNYYKFHCFHLVISIHHSIQNLQLLYAGNQFHAMFVVTHFETLPYWGY